jgi:GH15 family glucan-1,4-alpha-glucosidase
VKRSEFGKEYVKLSKDGDFQKCKARWVQDKQKNTQQTDSLAASRAGFRCATQLATNHGWDLYHMYLKTALLQGEAMMNFWNGHAEVLMTHFGWTFEMMLLQLQLQSPLIHY